MTKTIGISSVQERAVIKEGEGKKVDILYFDGGGAHKGVARALEAELKRAFSEASVRAVNTDLIFSHFPLLAGLTRAGISLYNTGLKWETLVGLRQYIALGKGLITLMQPAAPRLAAFWQHQAPHMLISTIPLYNGLMFTAAREINPEVRCVTIPVDFEEFSRQYWFDPSLKSYYLCGTERLVQQALQSGVPESQVFPLRGMPVHPSFLEPIDTDPADALDELGLRRDLPTVLVFFGGQGSRYLVDIVQRLDASATPCNLIAICGCHKAAYDSLNQWRSRKPKLIVGYTAKVAEYMRLADVMVGKPGPISIHEAIACRVPLVLVDNPSMRILFEYNIRWAEENGIAKRVRSLTDVPGAVNEILASDHWYRNVARLNLDANAGVAACLRQLM